MSSRHLVDDELLPVLDALPMLGWDAAGLAEARTIIEQMGAAIPCPEVPVAFETRLIPGSERQPDIPVFIYRPAGATGRLPSLLHIHGGGYVAGSPRLADAQNRLLANELQCLVVSVDYRLAPEVPHPGPIEDCYAALKWLHGNADALSLDTRRIAIRGESAGGGLAAALAILARDRGEIPIVFQVLVYPMLDDRTASGIDPSPYSGEFMWRAESNVFGWSSYLGGPPGGDTPSYAAAAREQNLSGLPPAFVAVGQLDLFIDENIEYARRLIAAGVPTELHVYPGAFHGFDLASHTQSAQAFQEAARTALKRAFQVR